LPHRNWKLRITDIIEAIEKILSYVEMTSRLVLDLPEGQRQ